MLSSFLFWGTILTPEAGQASSEREFVIPKGVAAVVYCSSNASKIKDALSLWSRLSSESVRLEEHGLKGANVTGSLILFDPNLLGLDRLDSYSKIAAKLVAVGSDNGFCVNLEDFVGTVRASVGDSLTSAFGTSDKRLTTLFSQKRIQAQAVVSFGVELSVGARKILVCDSVVSRASRPVNDLVSSDVGQTEPPNRRKELSESCVTFGSVFQSEEEKGQTLAEFWVKLNKTRKSASEKLRANLKLLTNKLMEPAEQRLGKPIDKGSKVLSDLDPKMQRILTKNLRSSYKSYGFDSFGDAEAFAQKASITNYRYWPDLQVTARDDGSNVSITWGTGIEELAGLSK